jgi:hypothetical protein
MAVYFLRCDLSGLTKIGRAEYPTRRVVDIQRMSGSPLRVVAILDVPDFHEKRLHRRHAKVRTHGEWFALAERDIPTTHPRFVRYLGPVAEVQSVAWPPAEPVISSSHARRWIAWDDLAAPVPRAYLIQGAPLHRLFRIGGRCNRHAEARLGQWIRDAGIWWADVCAEWSASRIERLTGFPSLEPEPTTFGSGGRW